MNKVSFELEVVTPLFLGGADGKTAELRPPSIRGAMRFWFRAMMGGIVGGDIEALKKLEADVFGDTDKASRIILRLSSVNLNKDNYNPLPHKTTGFKFEGFKPDQRFNLHFSVRNPKDLPKLEIAILSFLLLINLGGLGKRSRRGFGSLRIIKSEGDLDKQIKSLLDSQPKSHKELEDKLEELIKLAGSKSRTFSNVKKKVSSNSDFPYINPDFQMMVLEKSYTTWEQAIKNVMLKMRSYKDAVFGSPDPRQASPLIVKIHKIENTYKVVLTAFLKTSLSPELKVDWGKMEDFLKAKF
jgi:CRISPR-associated protein Cmr1